MGKMKPVFFFALGAVFFAACGTTEIKFPYAWFHVSPIKAWEFPQGKLLGDGVTHKLEDCKPRRNNDGEMVQTCVVVFYDELTKVITDYKQTKQSLIDCQRGR